MVILCMLVNSKDHLCKQMQPFFDHDSTVMKTSKPVIAEDCTSRYRDYTDTRDRLTISKL